MIEIPLVCCDGPEIRRHVLRADEGIGSAFALGDVVGVAPVPVDHLVQMLAPVLSDAEPMDLFARRFQEIRELRAVGTVTRELRWPAPVGWFHGNPLCARFQLRAANVQPIGQRGGRLLHVSE